MKKNTRTKKSAMAKKKSSEAKLTAEERAKWANATRGLVSLGRIMREARAARWTGQSRIIDPLFGAPGDVPANGGTSPEEFFSRPDNGSV